MVVVSGKESGIRGHDISVILGASMAIRDKLISGPLGFGTAPLGNMFRDIPDAEADATVDAAWQQGIRYFDTASFYGAGLSEIRLGRALSGQRRDDYLLSSKVGRIVLDEVDRGSRNLGEKAGLFEHGRPNRVVYDYSADATLRSIEDSLKRLGVDRLDFVWIHDISRDFTATSGSAISRRHAREPSGLSRACASKASSGPGGWA